MPDDLSKTAAAVGRERTGCGYCHWSFDSHAPGCAQCAYGRYAEARDAYRAAHGLTRDSGSHYVPPYPSWWDASARETEALLIAMRDSDADSGIYEVDEYLDREFLAGELRRLAWAAELLADRARKAAQRKRDGR